MFNKRLKIILIAFAVLSIILTSVFLMGESFGYIGAAVCGKCHSRKYMLDQYEKWLSSPHSRAFRTLKTSKAEKIAARSSVPVAYEDEKCLKCHTTANKKNSKLNTEGVGCESCHGPGSGYAELDKHVNFRYRRNGYYRAKKYGMYPVLDYEPDLKKREKLCRHCHNRNRPCYPRTNEEIMKQIITIQVIDTLKKGDVDFSHPLRRY